MPINYVPPRVLLDLGFAKLYWWGFFIAFAFLISLFLISREFKKKKIDTKHVYIIGLLSLIGMVVGSRLLYVFYNFSHYLKNPLEIFLITHGGMISYGGIILSVVLVIIYIKIKKLDLGEIVDSIAPYLALGFAIGRIGCFLNGCCYGIPTSLPWGMTFPLSQTIEFRHPTQLYLILGNLLIFILLMIGKKKQENGKCPLKTEGSLFLFYLIIYSILRFLIDFVKVNHEFIWIFSVGQIINIGIFIISLILLIIKKIHRKF